MGATLGNADVLSAEITMPLVGSWTARVETELAAELVNGPARLRLEDRSFAGTIVDVSTFHGRTGALLVGGAGGLSKTLPARHWMGPFPVLDLPLSEWLLDSGETLAADVDRSSGDVISWTRPRGIASGLLEDILRELDAQGAFSDGAAHTSWRIRADGTLWLGVEPWPSLPATAAIEVLEEDPVASRAIVADGGLALAPGVTWNNRRVVQVIHRWKQSSLRTEVLFERAHGGAKASLEAFVRRLVAPTLFHAAYPCLVVHQWDDGSVDVRADPDLRMRLDPYGPGADRVFSHIPIRSLPGVNVKVAPPVEAVLMFERGSPGRPFVALWRNNSAFNELVFDNGTKPIARVDDAVHAGSVLIVQNSSTFAVLSLQAFEGTPAGDIAAAAALAAALGAGNIAFLATLNTGRITSGNPKLKA